MRHLLEYSESSQIDGPKHQRHRYMAWE